MTSKDTDGRVDLRTLRVSFPEALTQLPLDIAILNGRWGYTSEQADAIRKGRRWNPLPFASLSHAAEILNQRLTHIFVTHWHIGADHRFESDITQLVRDLKKARGLPGIGSGPLLVATYHTPLDKDLSDFLEKTYDCHMTLLQAFTDPVQWLAEQLWARLPSRMVNTV